MALKFEIDTLDGLDDGLKPLYEAKDGKYRLIVEGIDPADELKKALEEAVDARKLWWEERQKSDWEKKSDAPPLPTSGQMIGKIFGIRPRLKDKPPVKK